MNFKTLLSYSYVSHLKQNVICPQVKRGDWPVLAARVEVTVTRPENNGSGIHREKFELLDTGSGGN